MNDLFSPIALGPLDLPHRVAMAPMTRSRSMQPGNVPNAMMAKYYAQRASAALIITEATQITPQGQGYSFTPGIHSPEQIAGWKLTTDAVHGAGGRIFSQLWHVGRMSHASFHADGRPVAPSALSPEASVWVVDPTTGQGSMVRCPTPRALETVEIPQIVADYGAAAANAKQAGFDGVEVHAANGYLIDEFLRTSSNERTDRYGGTPANRIRFALEVVEAVASQIGAERTGIRFSPFITQRRMDDPSAPETILKLATELNRLGLAYIHLAEADWEDAPVTPRAFREALRNAFSGKIIVAGKYTKERANNIIAEGFADVVAFGRPFIASPDLPRRFREDLPLADFDSKKLFGGSEDGYSTYSGFHR